jgi:hypothetical protein
LASVAWRVFEMLDLGYAIVKREKINKPILKEKNRRYYAKFL